MNKQELIEKHKLYKANIKEWTLYNLVYDSGEELIKFALPRYSTRETVGNWKERQADGYVFNYAQTIVDLFNFYLTEKEANRNLEALDDDPQWKAFEKDADLDNTDFNTVIKDAQKLASVCGSIGILVNKPASNSKTLTDENSAGVYPYLSPYSLPNIFDWKIERNINTHRKELKYLKLFEEDETFLLWWPEKWERWVIDKKTNVPKLESSGENPLGEIPFVWMPNLKRTQHSFLGISDIVDISRIVLSIIRNLSCGEEILKLAGFPMMRVPMERNVTVEEEEGETETPTGQRVVHEFDPSFGGDAKPDWMPTEILDSIEAILKWVEKKENEAYRTAHLSGVHGQRISGEPQSGLAMRYGFQQLFSVLSKKSDNMCEAEFQIVRLWLRWQNREELLEKIYITRSKDYSVDDLAVALDNAFTAMKNMYSKTFRIRLQEKVSESMLPDLTDEDRKKIETETEAKTPEDLPEPENDPRNVTGGGTTIKPADQAAKQS